MRKYIKTIQLFTLAVAATVLGACTSNNKSTESQENITVDSATLPGEWHLASYRIDCESTQFEDSSNYMLSFNEAEKIFSLSTDCNRINGSFEISNDTIRFQNMLVTEMACESMTVEQNMLRLLNDSSAYAVVCPGDTLAFTAPAIGSAIFIKPADAKSISD